jgi:hypothetical protein
VSDLSVTHSVPPSNSAGIPFPVPPPPDSPKPKQEPKPKTTVLDWIRNGFQFPGKVRP